MFCNILAEMARNQLSKQEIADKLGVSVVIFEKKLKNESSFNIKEIFMLQKIFNNPQCTFEYLLSI